MENKNISKSRGREYEDLGRKLAAFRESRGYNQTQFAKIFGMAQSTYAGYESGIRKMPLSLLKKIIDYFDLNANYFFNSEPDQRTTVAAHHDGEEWTDEELTYIELTKKMLLEKRRLR